MRTWQFILIVPALLAALWAERSSAQTGGDQFLADMSAEATRNLGIIGGNGYAKFTAQRLYRKDGRICTESRQQIAPAFTHYACVNPAELDLANLHGAEFAKFYHSLNIGRDELDFGAAIGCRGYPCVHEAVVYDGGQFPTIYRLESHFSVGCYTRCDGVEESLRRLAQMGGAAPPAFAPDIAARMTMISDKIADETKARWPAEPAPPYFRPSPGAAAPLLPVRALAVLGDTLCAAAKSGDATMTYNCAKLSDLDPAGLGGLGECGPNDQRRRDGSCAPAGRAQYNNVAPIFPGMGSSQLEMHCRLLGCVKVTNFDSRTGNATPAGSADSIQSTCNLNCSRIAPLLREALQLAAPR